MAARIRRHSDRRSVEGIRCLGREAHKDRKGGNELQWKVKYQINEVNAEII